MGELLALWDDLRGDCALPSRSEFHAELLRKWLAHIGIVQVVWPGPRFRVTLAGTQINIYDGMDLTGKFFDEIIPTSIYENFIAPYLATITTRQPIVDELDYYKEPGTSLLPSPTYVPVRRIILPCAKDGETTDHFIVGLFGYRKTDSIS